MRGKTRETKKNQVSDPPRRKNQKKKDKNRWKERLCYKKGVGGREGKEDAGEGPFDGQPRRKFKQDFIRERKCLKEIR